MLSTEELSAARCLVNWVDIASCRINPTISTTLDACSLPFLGFSSSGSALAGSGFEASLLNIGSVKAWRDPSDRATPRHPLHECPGHEVQSQADRLLAAARGARCVQSPELACLGCHGGVCDGSRSKSGFPVKESPHSIGSEVAEPECCSFGPLDQVVERIGGSAGQLGDVQLVIWGDQRLMVGPSLLTFGRPRIRLGGRQQAGSVSESNRWAADPIDVSHGFLAVPGGADVEVGSPASRRPRSRARPRSLIRSWPAVRRRRIR